MVVSDGRVGVDVSSVSVVEGTTSVSVPRSVVVVSSPGTVSTPMLVETGGRESVTKLPVGVVVGPVVSEPGTELVVSGTSEVVSAGGTSPLGVAGGPGGVSRVGTEGTGTPGVAGGDDGGWPEVVATPGTDGTPAVGG